MVFNGQPGRKWGEKYQQKSPHCLLPRRPVRAKRWVWVGCVCHKHALPTQYLTIECRMVEQKKVTPVTARLWLLGSGPRQGTPPCPRGNLAQVKWSMEEKRTPTNHPHPVGGGLLKIRRCVKRNRLLMPGASIASPMPRKRKPPLTAGPRANGG
jgi:hypothetical protein